MEAKNNTAESSKYPIYLDNNATTPLAPEVLDEMLPFFTQHFGNAASRFHAFGWKAEEAVATARLQVAEMLAGNEKEIIFTSGATESVNLAIKGIFEANKQSIKHIITAITEHKAVLDTCQHLEKLGAEITYLSVDNQGLINLDELQAAINSNTILISIMLANNETGVLQPFREIAEIARKHKIIFHTDATQAIGKIPINVIEDKIDLLSFSGHKIYAPKGVGVLYARKNIQLVAQQDGGRHERGRRSGTLNVPSIVAIGKASEIAMQCIDNEEIRLKTLRDKLEKNIIAQLPNAQINGSQAKRIPNTSNISFGGVDGEMLLMKLHKIAVSNGSACNSASTEPSYVLKAMGLDGELAYSSVRFSLGKFTQESDIDLAIHHVVEVVNMMRNEH